MLSPSALKHAASANAAAAKPPASSSASASASASAAAAPPPTAATVSAANFYGPATADPPKQPPALVNANGGKSVGKIREALCSRPNECMCVGFCTPWEDTARGSFANAKTIEPYKIPDFHVPATAASKQTCDPNDCFSADSAGTPAGDAAAAATDISKGKVHVHAVGTATATAAPATAATASATTASVPMTDSKTAAAATTATASATASASGSGALAPVAPVDSQWLSPSDPYGAAVPGTKAPSATNSIAAFKSLTAAATAALAADATAVVPPGTDAKVAAAAAAAAASGAAGHVPPTSSAANTIYQTYTEANVAHKAYDFNGPLCPVVDVDDTNKNPYEQWRAHPNWHHSGSLAPRIMGIHNSFRNDLRNLTYYYNKIERYGDNAFRTFRQEFLDEVRYVDGHHRCEEEHCYPRMEELCGVTMDTPLMEAQHHELLMRTAAVMSILSAKPRPSAIDGNGQSDDAAEGQQQQLVHDLGIEFDGWQTCFLNHLRDEEALMMPLFLKVGRRYWGDNLKWRY